MANIWQGLIREIGNRILRQNLKQKYMELSDPVVRQL